MAITGCDNSGRTVHLGNETDPGAATDRNLSIVDAPLPLENVSSRNAADALQAVDNAEDVTGNALK